MRRTHYVEYIAAHKKPLERLTVLQEEQKYVRTHET